MSINRYNQLDLLPYNLDPGATIARNDLIQLLGNKAAREVQTTENDFSFSNVAIVRVVEKVEDLSEISGKEMKSLIVDPEDNVIYAAYLEIDGLTSSFENLFNKVISKDEYYGSLLKVYINPAASNNRLPISNEIVIVDYEDPQQFNTIRFTGYPSLKPEIDPKLSEYTEQENRSARQFFSQGA
jgi:hypothetical protein